MNVPGSMRKTFCTHATPLPTYQNFPAKQDFFVVVMCEGWALLLWGVAWVQFVW